MAKKNTKTQPAARQILDMNAFDAETSASTSSPLLQRRIANVGVHGKPVELRLEKLWTRNITLTTGLVCTHSTPMLLQTVASGKVKPEQLVTHRFALEDILDAYEVFGNAAREKAMKVILRAEA